MDNPSFMITALCERQREIGELMNGSKLPGEIAGSNGRKEKASAGGGTEPAGGRDGNQDGDELGQNDQSNKPDTGFRVDPFFLLREVTEMGNLQANMKAKREGTLTMKQEMAMQSYDHMVQKCYEDMMEAKKETEKKQEG